MDSEYEGADTYGLVRASKGVAAAKMLRATSMKAKMEMARRANMLEMLERMSTNVKES